MMDPTVAKLVEHWNALHKEGRFSALDIREYWRIQVPEIYSPPVCNKEFYVVFATDSYGDIKVYNFSSQEHREYHYVRFICSMLDYTIMDANHYFAAKSECYIM